MLKNEDWRQHLTPMERLELSDAEIAVSRLRNRAIKRMRLAHKARAEGRIRQQRKDLPRPQA